MPSKYDGKSVESFEESDGFWLCIVGGSLAALKRVGYSGARVEAGRPVGGEKVVA